MLKRVWKQELNSLSMSKFGKALKSLSKSAGDEQLMKIIDSIPG